MRKSLGVLGVAAALLMASTGVQAATIVQTGSHLPGGGFATTNWATTFVVNQFDPSLGTLNSITFTLSGAVQGRIRVENLDAAPASVTASLQALLQLTRPDNSVLVNVLPSSSQNLNLAAFDNAIDFGGPSGFDSGTFTTPTATNSSTSPPPPTDLALFTGLGTITLPVTATGQTEATGAGNLATIFNTAAHADFSVTYDFTPVGAVPEPSTMVLAGVGIATLGLSRIRRRRR